MSAPIPEEHQQLMPYIIVDRALDFKVFLEKVFNASHGRKIMRDEQTVMHGEVNIGNCTIMYADTTDQWSAVTGGFFIYVPNADEIYKKALSEGAMSLMAPCDQNYGRACGVKDPFGNTWWITSIQ